MSALEEVQRAAADAADRVGPSVVAVGRGAGVVVAAGRVLTNAHNLVGPSVPVRFADGSTVAAEVTATDVDGDLAVVSVDTGDLEPIEIRDAEVALGSAVLALGAPRRGPGRVTVGFVSSTVSPFRGPRGRRLTGIEHTAPLGRGSSGGPVLELGGAVIGINTHRRGDGFYLALPATADLRERIGRLAGGESPRRRRLGVALAPADVARRLRAAVGLPERDGLLVREVDEGSAAERAGVREGDLLVTADGAALSDPDDLADRLERGGERLVLALVRGVEEVEVTVTFEADRGA
ncbi:S1C family serine protease [Egicoccus sp. AB-alg2]|uniref:S1C family serine protease n=1 Tax=Egicoccus sp. AB-alg2 TaxID=3242693 RepID=UPI00359D1464